jgi:phosphatidate cytidylyltransferase
LGLKLCWDNFGRIFPSWGEVLLLALVFSVLGPLGDLCESRFKRLSGVKDSGKTFTGHGGMLDIIDSLLFTTIFYYGYLLLYHPEVFI